MFNAVSFRTGENPVNKTNEKIPKSPLNKPLKLLPQNQAKAFSNPKQLTQENDKKTEELLDQFLKQKSITKKTREIPESGGGSN